ncbi:MAG TPA: four helix bundle protein [Bacteroidia bacterium]|jgi:four helix bundle protein|nr:four helix bundle protein [Bacteroidia bacterium]
MKTGNAIVDLSFEFALKIVEYTEILEERRRFVISNQLLKSGTSIGANVRESQSAESRADFVHKLKISSKEINETEYWLLLCKYSSKYPDPKELLHDIDVLKRVSGKIIASCKN